METAGSGKVLRGAPKRNAITGYIREVAPVVDHPFIYLELWIPLPSRDKGFDDSPRNFSDYRPNWRDKRVDEKCQ